MHLELGSGALTADTPGNEVCELILMKELMEGPKLRRSMRTSPDERRHATNEDEGWTLPPDRRSRSRTSTQCAMSQAQKLDPFLFCRRNGDIWY